MSSQPIRDGDATERSPTRPAVGLVQRSVRRAFQAAGLKVSRTDGIPHDVASTTAATIRLVRPYTSTSVERIHALCHAIHHLVGNAIPGSIVECGVWKGGSMMAAARTLLEAGDRARDLYLYDTFEGMVEPGPLDLHHDGTPALAWYRRATRAADGEGWCAAGEDEVRKALALVAYPPERIHLVKGRVEDTLPEQAPETIALLRLDTDWYDSTMHELVTLYPRLVPGGVLIIDDYGFWQGARRAVDEFFAAQPRRPLLHRVDETARIAVVPGW